MITFSKLGKFGAMGNQLFQYAALYGVAKKTGFEMQIPPLPDNVQGHFRVIGHSKEGNPIEEYAYSLGYFDITSRYLSHKEYDLIMNHNNKKQTNWFLNKLSPSIIKYEYKETQFHFDSNLFNIKDGTDIEGYFQSEKYFLHCSADIRSEFSVKKQFYKEAQSKLNKYRSNADQIISAHVRRAGHELPEYQHVHKYPDETYYHNAMEYFRTNLSAPIFLFFSDDIDWCKSRFIAKDIYFSENNSSITDFTMMSKCDHNIIVPSSFSWWASWLNKNKNKIVTVPPNGELFGPKGPKETKDYFPPGVTRISTK